MNAQLRSNVQVPGQALAEFCRRNGVRRLAFFGSVLRGDFRSDSDVDVLVEFEPGHSVGYLSMAAMEIELGGSWDGGWTSAPPRSSAATSATTSFVSRRSAMRREDEIRLRHMIEAGEAAIRYLGGASTEDLAGDDMRARAIIQAVGVIGEAASRVSDELRSAHPDVPWAAIVGMRNRLVHACFDIDPGRVHDTVVSDVPRLLSRIRGMLLEADSEPEASS